MKNRAGFTLIEVLIAVAILIVGIIAVIQLYPASLKQARTAAERTVVSELANSHLSKVRAEGAERLFNNPDLLMGIENIYAFRQADGLYTGVPFYSIQHMAGVQDVFLQRVTYTVQMADGRLETFVTYVAKQ